MKMAATTKNVVLQQNQAATASSNMQKLSLLRKNTFAASNTLLHL